MRPLLAAITPLGRLLVALLALGLIAGGLLHWAEGWFIAVLAAVLLLLALPFLLGARAYRTAILVHRGRVVAGGELELGIRVHNTSRRAQLPALAELPVGDALRELVVPPLSGLASITLPVSLLTERRGLIRVGPLTVARQDPIGLLRREIRWRDWHLVHVHPRTVALPSNSAGLVRDLEGQASRRLSDADLSFHAIREYAPGDAVRHIHWKATAKTGALMVRQYEESQTARVAVLFDARADEYAGDAEFELGLSAAASFSVQAVREGRERFIGATGRAVGGSAVGTAGAGARTGVSARARAGAAAGAEVGWRSQGAADGLAELPSLTIDQLLDSWAELGESVGGSPLEALARSLAESRRPLSIVVMVTGSTPELARIRRAASAFPADVRVLAVRADRLAEPRAQRIGTLTVLTVGALDDLPSLLMRGLG